MPTINLTAPQVLLHFVLTTIVFFAIDMVWLGVIAKSFYRRFLGHLMATRVRWGAAIAFYLLYIVGILLFVVYPTAEMTAVDALSRGIMFGLFTYATYDLTNFATLKGWPTQIVFIDILWGMTLTGAVGIASWTILQYI